MRDLILPNFAALGASTAPDGDAWSQYMQGIIARLQAAETRATTDYKTLRDVREKLGLPFVANPSGEGAQDPGVLPPDIEAQGLDILGMSAFTRDALKDAIAGKRELIYQASSDDFAIQGLDTDLVRVDVPSEGVARLVDVKTGNPAHVTGTIGSPLFEYAAIAGLTLAVPGFGAAFLVVEMVDKFDGIMTTKLALTLAKKSAELVQSGKATPEQAQAMTDSILKGSAALQAEKNKGADASGLTKLSDTVTTLGYLGLAGLVIYGVFQFLPRSHGALSPARLENKRPKEPADEEGAHELELYISSDRRFSMDSPDGIGHAVRENMFRKYQRGKYDHALAPKGWRYVTDAAAKAYSVEHGRTHFSPATRDIVAESLANEWLAKVQSGETWGR